MSRIDELLSNLAPQGVPFVELGAVSANVSGLSGKTKADFVEDGNVRFVSYKNAFSNLVVDQQAPDFVKIRPGEKQNELRMGDVVFTGSSESLTDVGMSSVVESEPHEQLLLNSFCFAVRFNHVDLFLPSFSKHLFRSNFVRSQIRKSASGVTRINISKERFSRIRVPVPPLEIQREIVRVLDQFIRLEAELEAELEARRSQYDYTNDALFHGSLSERVALGDLGTFQRGRRFTKNDRVDQGLPSIHYGEIYTHYGTSTDSALMHVDSDLLPRLRFASPGDVIIAGVSETVEDVGRGVAWLGEMDVAFHDDSFRFRSNVADGGAPLLDAKYVAHFLRTADFQGQKRRFVSKGKMKRLSSEGIAMITIPLVSPAEQRRIAAVLDALEGLTQDLSIGLPAEIAARRKQYEYYRDKLLTFDEPPA